MHSVKMSSTLACLAVLASISLLLACSSAYPPPWKVAQSEDKEESRSWPSDTMEEGVDPREYHYHRSRRYQYSNSELLYRLDVVPCKRARIPPPGIAWHYTTSIVYNYRRRRFQCIPVKLPNEEKLTDRSVELYSPGYAANRPYPPRRLSYYHINCTGNIIFNIKKFHLQAPINAYPMGQLCVDYLRLTDGLGSEERCGEIIPQTDLFSIDSGNVLLTFRSSRFNNYRGFDIVATCKNNNVMSEQEQFGCLKMDTLVQEETGSHSSEKPKQYYATVEKLIHFQRGRASQGQHGAVMSAREAKKHRAILKLAVLSERSCEAVLQAVGREVSKLFPRSMVLEERIQVLEDILLYHK